MDFIHSVQDRDKKQALVNMEIGLAQELPASQDGLCPMPILLIKWS